MKRPKALNLLPLLILGACSAGACDPGNAGFFGGIGCSAGNGYQQRTVGLQNASAAARQDADLSESRAAAEARNAEVAQAQLAALHKEIADMQRSQDVLRQKLTAAQKRRGAEDTEYLQAKAHLAALDQRLHAVQSTPNPDSTSVQRLVAAQQALLAECGAL
jgi:hypothetical protein